MEGLQRELIEAGAGGVPGLPLLHASHFVAQLRLDQLRQRVLDGSLTPTALAALDEEALAPPAVAQRRADDRSRLAKRVGARPSTLPEVDAFECPRCGARRAYVANATHGGSVDRAHILARCLECGRGWAP